MTHPVFPEVALMPLRRNLARLLLVDTDPASRLALETLLTKAGYTVECAATSVEAMAKLDLDDYQLVLADLKDESQDSGSRLLAYARQKECRPATALLASSLYETESRYETEPQPPEWSMAGGCVRMSADNVLFLLDRVAGLIGDRADRRMRQNLQRARMSRAN
jgi:CheY-like chemotaxis protein